MIYVKENSMETLKIFGERLRALRDERHLRQADMAEVLQITLVHYQRMEYGKVNVPSL
ncbi:MAG: helix-turn-helix domain-containing protein, partial [Dysosmobacter welbionis]